MLESISNLKQQIEFLASEQKIKLEFDTNDFLILSNNSIQQNNYETFAIPKKSGGERVINAPTKQLLNLQKGIQIILTEHHSPHPCSFGFEKDKSIYDNALKHINKELVINVDIANFFHSISYNSVKEAVITTLNVDSTLASLITNISTIDIENTENISTRCLPQGGPCSPLLSNIVFKVLDDRLNELAQAHNLTYSRYADDLTFSGNDIKKPGKFVDEVAQILNRYKLELNPKKTRFQYPNKRQEVTGLVVNQKVNVSSKYIKDIRFALYLWERYGLAKANTIYSNHLQKKQPENYVYKGVLTQDRLGFHLRGRLAFIKSILGSESIKYRKLMIRFNKVSGLNQTINSSFSTWESKGALAAYNHFKTYKKKISLEDFLTKLDEMYVLNKQQHRRYSLLIRRSLFQTVKNSLED